MHEVKEDIKNINNTHNYIVLSLKLSGKNHRLWKESIIPISEYCLQRYSSDACFEKNVPVFMHCVDFYLLLYLRIPKN